MNKFLVLGMFALILSVYASSSDSISPKKQPVEEADAGPYNDNDDTYNTDGTDSEGDSQDEDVIQMDDEDSDSEDDSNSDQ